MKRNILQKHRSIILKCPFSIVILNFRVHSNTFAYGKIKNGELQFTSGSVGGNPSIQSGKWYRLKIEVAENRDVKLFLNGVQLGSTFKASFTTRGYGGVLVANGYSNVVQFRNYDVAPQIAEL